MFGSVGSSVVCTAVVCVSPLPTGAVVRPVGVVVPGLAGVLTGVAGAIGAGVGNAVLGVACGVPTVRSVGWVANAGLAEIGVAAGVAAGVASPCGALLVVPALIGVAAGTGGLTDAVGELRAVGVGRLGTVEIGVAAAVAAGGVAARSGCVVDVSSSSVGSAVAVAIVGVP